jgi:hypothetical protein
LIVVKWRITMCSAGRFEPINPVGLQARAIRAATPKILAKEQANRTCGTPNLFARRVGQRPSLRPSLVLLKT